MASAGDVNGDGIADLIVGVHDADPDGRAVAGASYVGFGAATGFAASFDLAELNGTNGFRIDGEAGDYSGSSVAGVGDFNGDGFADVVIGAAAAAPGGRERAGSSYIVFGSNAGFPAVLDLGELGGSDGFRIDGIAAFDRSGNGVAGAGDVNADGPDDLIIVAPDGGYAGEAYVIYGFRTGPTPPIVGGPGPDDLTGTPGEDRMFGRAGDDLLDGEAGRDILRGGQGDDLMRGRGGGDALFGGHGKDRLRGGSGDDRLVGGAGADVFVFAAGFGSDRIDDFDADPLGGQDRIDLRRLGVTLASFEHDVDIRDLGADTRLTVDGCGAILLRGATGDAASALDATDFILSG